MILQRVTRASVTWTPAGGEKVENRIGAGLLVLVGVGPDDGAPEVARMVDKVANLRIFQGADGRFDSSLLDVGGEALVVSQFTLFADARRGRRPSFAGAASPDAARRLFEDFSDHLTRRGVICRQGGFGEHMEVSLVNDGPVTIALSSEPWDTSI